MTNGLLVLLLVVMVVDFWLLRLCYFFRLCILGFEEGIEKILEKIWRDWLIGDSEILGSVLGMFLESVGVDIGNEIRVWSME